MAKKSGSLFGRADASLVQAAFAEGRTKGPADYTGVYKTMAENYGKMADNLVKEAQETYEAVYKKEIALNETFKEADQLISNGNFSDADLITFNNIVDDYRNRAKEISKIKDPKERKEAELLFNSQFNKFQKNIPLMEQELVKVAKFVANDQHVVGGMDDRFGNTNTENSDFLIGVANLHLGKKDESLKAVRTVENGDIFYEVTTSTGKKVKLNQNDIQNLLPVEDHNAKQQLNEVGNLAKTAGGTKGQKYDPNFISNSVFDIVGKSENAADTWQTIARYKSNFGDESFYDALHNPKSILGEQIKTSLINANLPDQFDIGDKGIDENDFLDAENFKKIKKYIMNNPRFGAKVMGDWFAATKGNSAFNAGRSILKNKGTGTGTSAGTGFLTTKKGVNSGTLNYYVFPKYDDAKLAYDQFKLASEGKDAEFSAAGAIYTFKTTGDNAYKWVETRSDKTTTVKGTTEDLIGPRGFGIKDSDFLAIENFVSEETVNPNGLPTETTRVEGTYSTIPGLEEKINFDTIETSDNKLSEILNGVIPTPGRKTNKNPEGYYFAPATDTSFFGGMTTFLMGGEDLTRAAVMLFDINGDPVKYPGTENYVYFKHKGENRENAIKNIDNVLKEFGFDKNINTSKVLD